MTDLKRTAWLIASCLAVLPVFTGCKTAEKSPPPESPTNRATFDKTYDFEIDEILTLAKRNEWVAAEEAARKLYDTASDNKRVERLYTWIVEQAESIRDKQLEDEIRKIDERESVFNPDPISLLTESKNRGLPPRRDVRDAVSQIESTPYIPDTYGKIIEKAGPLFDIESPDGKMAKILDERVSIKLDDATLDSIIFTVGDTVGVNFVADRSIEAFTKKISVNFTDVRLKEFLDYVSRNMDIQFQVGDDLIWIVDAKDPSRVLEETRFYRLKEGFILPAAFGPDKEQRVETRNKDVVTTVTTTEFEQFVRDGALQSPSIERAIEKFFKGSDYMVDYERNLIIASGTREQLEVLENLIEEFDTPIQQVLIEARFITVSTAAYMQLGALWETASDSTSPRSPIDFTGFGPDNVGIGLQEQWTDVLGRDDLRVTLSALEQGGESQTLSAPRITLVNNLPSKISDGKVQYYYEEYTVSQVLTDTSSASSLYPKGKPQKITSGVSLDVMASIGGDGESVMLALNPEVNQDVQLVKYADIVINPDSGETFEIRLPESRTQSLSTRVIVKSGQTVVMGGVLLRDQTTFVESVPILGSIPIIGAAFRRRTEVDQPRYLLIFVTAYIVAESGEFVIYNNASTSTGNP